MTDAQNTTDMTGAEFLVALRAINWRQTDFAHRTGTTPESVNRWVHGRQPVPTWAAAHVRLLHAADQFHRAHVAPPPRSRKTRAKPITEEGEDA